MNLEQQAFQATYDLSKKIPDMQGRGFIIGTSYGDLEIGAEEGAAITRAVQRLLERRLAACKGAR